MARPLWFVKLIQRAFPTRLWLSELTKVPGLGHLVDAMLFGGDDIIYLPRDTVIPVNQPIPQPSEMALPSAVVRHFIEEAQHHWIMNFCICRESDHCQEYPHELGCIFLGEAVHQIDPRLGRLASREEALAHLDRCREAGLVHMIGRNKLDTIWLGAGPGERLLTICNCCPCCCLWKALPRLDPMISRKITRMPGVTVQVTAACKGCKLCLREVCFVEAIQMNGQVAVIDPGLCRGCGRCVEMCPLDAIELAIEGADYLAAAIDRIEPLVDLS